jgi:hypothetical protein
MGFRKVDGTPFDYALISFDSAGGERTEPIGKVSEKFIESVSEKKPTDIFFFSHGWKGDLPAAEEQYDLWIGSLAKQIVASSASGIKPMFCGLHWPSLPFGDEEFRKSGTAAAGPMEGMGPDLYSTYFSRLGAKEDLAKPLRTVVDQAKQDVYPDEMSDEVEDAYYQLDSSLGLGNAGPAGAPDSDREGFNPRLMYQRSTEASFDEVNLFSGILAPLRQLSYWRMKARARDIGESGMHMLLLRLQEVTATSKTRIHLMGHSFGTIVVSSMISGPANGTELIRPVDSVSLVQGAVSLWSFSPKIEVGRGGRGYFANLLQKKWVSGPIITTQSRFDKAVCTLYPIAGHISGSPDFKVGIDDVALPEIGAIGQYGIRGVPQYDVSNAQMLAEGKTYSFSKGAIFNLESSEFICHGDGISGAHSDIAGPEVSQAILAAARASIE